MSTVNYGENGRALVPLDALKLNAAPRSSCGNTAFQLGLSDHKYNNGGEAYGFFVSCSHNYGAFYWR